MGGSIDYRISSNETWTWSPKVFSSVWGEEHDVLGQWEHTDSSETTSSGYGMGAYRHRGESGVLVWGGVYTPSDNVTDMTYPGKTMFWKCQ